MEIDNLKILQNLAQELSFLDNDIVFNKKYGDLVAINSNSYEILKTISYIGPELDLISELKKLYGGNIMECLELLVIECRKKCDHLKTSILL